MSVVAEASVGVYVVKRTHLLVRRRTVQNCREKLRHYERLLVEDTPRGTIYRYPEEGVSRLFATLMNLDKPKGIPVPFPLAIIGQTGKTAGGPAERKLSAVLIPRS